MARRDDMQVVELVDGAPATGPADPADPAAGPRPRTRWRRLVVGVLAVVVVAATAQGVVTARERAALARLAELPGVLAPVDADLRVLHPVRIGDGATLSPVATSTFEVGADGAQTVRWFAAGSADPLWTTQVAGPDARLTSTDVVTPATRCTTDAEPGADPSTARRHVCLVSDGATYYDPGTDETETVRATTTSVVVLSTADGSEVARWPLPGGEALAVLPGDLVVVGVSTDDAATNTATGYDLLTGAERWTSELPVPRSTHEGSVQVSRAGDLVAFGPSFSSLVLLDPATGETVRDDLLSGVEAGYGWWSTRLDGTLAVTVSSVGGRDRTTLVAADGDPAKDRRLDGVVLEPSVDDGSLSDLLLTLDRGAVHAWDAATGRARWTSAVGSATTAFVVRGRVYVGIQQGAVALDGGTGVERWHADGVAGMEPGIVLTDGRNLLLPLEGGEGGQPSLAAYDLVDGHEVFRSPYPDGVAEVRAAGRTLVGFDDAGNAVVLG
jgi:hypothetical protein